MEEAALTRHTFVFLTPEGRARLYSRLAPSYAGEALALLRETLAGAADVPGIVRRGEAAPGEAALGFVPCRRLSDGRRLRVAARVPYADIREVRSVFDVQGGGAPARTRCVAAALALMPLAASLGIRAGALGSAGLELATGLPYTDGASDLDLLLEPAPYARLAAFAAQAAALYAGLPMDVELALPDGYGVKLAELFSPSRTVLGKGLRDVRLLERKRIMEMLG